jgi:hypothetical protein
VAQFEHRKIAVENKHLGAQALLRHYSAQLPTIRHYVHSRAFWPWNQLRAALKTNHRRISSPLMTDTGPIFAGSSTSSNRTDSLEYRMERSITAWYPGANGSWVRQICIHEQVSAHGQADRQPLSVRRAVSVCIRLELSVSVSRQLVGQFADQRTICRETNPWYARSDRIDRHS